MMKLDKGTRVRLDEISEEDILLCGVVGDVMEIVGEFDGKHYKVRYTTKFGNKCTGWVLPNSISLVDERVELIKSLTKRVDELEKTMRDYFRVPIEEEVHSVSENDVIEFEGQRYKKVDRKARVGDLVVFTNVEQVCHKTKDGQPYEAYYDGQLRYRNGNKGGNMVYGWDTRCPNPDVYELIEKQKFGIKNVRIVTKNQQRAEVIEKAKGYCKGVIGKCEYFVNVEKRTVVAIVKDFYDGKNVLSRGIAKCTPTDVFNEHIGKAIALGRALGLDVSEFTNAVVPDEVVKGMNVLFLSHSGEPYKSGVVAEYKPNFDGCDLMDEKLIHPLASPTNKVGKVTRDGFNILDDTNAEYEGDQ